MNHTTLHSACIGLGLDYHHVYSSPSSRDALQVTRIAGVYQGQPNRTEKPYMKICLRKTK